MSSTFVGLLSNIIASADLKVLHERLITLFDESYRYTTDESTTVCCEIIEENLRIQAKLFRLLQLCCDEGGTYGGFQPLKNKLMPLLCNGLVMSHIGGSEDVKLVRDKYEHMVSRLEDDLKSAQREVGELRLKLSENEEDVKCIRRQLKDSYVADRQVTELQKRLSDANLELEASELEIRKVREETGQLKKENSDLHARLQKQMLVENESEPVRMITKPYANGILPLHARAPRLVERFAELYGGERLELMDALRPMGDRAENERLSFCIVEECFMVCKAEQRRMRKKVRHALQPPNGSLIDASQTAEIVDSYMSRNTENFDVETLIPEILKCLHRNASVNQSIPYKEKLILPFIRACVRVVWSMVALQPPIDIAIALDGDIINEARYRRSYNSEFSATVVEHFVWPALMRDGKVVAKGEVVTKRIPANKLKKDHSDDSRPQSAEPFSRSIDLGIASMSSSWSEGSTRRRYSP
ncbi:mitochondria-eating protein isoform X1 [Nematostella vectensis]|uniref:mitochondria-eating protein isoform X1 n=1 Tax=Nematostella vectensis TaxID=45351 RepID=UPI0020772E27|nr:mitochondria-eating protein isoform X1 [Nematostella vectensis]